MTKSKLEKVLEYMVNGEKELASEMLHEHIIESAREIYADIAEEDDHAEGDLELDEDEDMDDDLDEGYHDDDSSGDFGDDLDSMDDEIETEEYFGEDDDDMEDDAMDDLDSEMDMGDDMDMDDDMGGDMDMDGDMDSGNGDAEAAMTNVEDAMDELKAIFADLMGSDMGDEEDMGDEVADEFDDMDLGDDMDDDMDDDLEDDKLGEDAKLHKQSVTMKGDSDGKASPLKQNLKGISDKGAPVKFAGGDEKGGKVSPPKKMNTVGPQDQKGKMDKKVPAPKNASEKAKSNIGS